MAKVMFPIVTLVLAGCASMGQWRDLRIDGSSQTAFDESLAALNADLPEWRREMLQLALVDIVRTESQNAEQSSDGGDDAYTDEDFRRQLDGMTYEGVIDLADQSGRPIAKIYYAGAGRLDPWEGRPWPQTDPHRFPATLVMPPGPPSGSP